MRKLTGAVLIALACAPAAGGAQNAMAVSKDGREQVLESPAFAAFVRPTTICPSKQLRFVTPGDLSWYEEAYEAQLSKPSARRLKAADAGESHCAGRDGLSCPTTATLAALEKTRLIGEFAAFACSHDVPR